MSSSPFKVITEIESEKLRTLSQKAAALDWLEKNTCLAIWHGSNVLHDGSSKLVWEIYRMDESADQNTGEVLGSGSNLLEAVYQAREILDGIQEE